MQAVMRASKRSHYDDLQSARSRQQDALAQVGAVERVSSRLRRPEGCGVQQHLVFRQACFERVTGLGQCVLADDFLGLCKSSLVTSFSLPA